MFYTLIAALALSVAQLLPFTATSTWDDVKNAVTTLTAADLEKHMNLTEGLSLNDNYLIDKQMARFVTVALVNGSPAITGRISVSDDSSLKDFVSEVREFRKANPAMYRGNATFAAQRVGPANTLTVIKTDEPTGNKVVIVFSDQPTTVPVHGHGGVDVDAYRPELEVIAPPKN